ncbi:phenylacetate--CoA ligase family protein [bacterium]|nr:phenylacetate--CoA ligase family protein [bacterium]
MLKLKLLKYFFELKKVEKYNEEKIKEIQLEKFRNIFEYAKRNSNFYEKLYKVHGVYDLGIKDFSDIEKIPLIYKKDLRNAGLDLIATNLNGRNIHTTSGSTGVPVKIAFSPYEDFTAHIRVLHILLKAGYKITDKIYMVTRYEQDDRFDIENKLSLLQVFQSKLKLFQRKIISIYTEPKIIVDTLIKEKPKVLWSTPSIMQIIVNELKKRQISLRIPLLLYTSETVFSDQEKDFREFLGDKIVNIYGCMESPTLCYDINLSGRMTTFPNSNLFEFKKLENNKLESYDSPIITNLINYSFPVIRYEVGDVVDNSFRDVSRKSFNIGKVYGRQDDIIRIAGDRYLAHHHAHEMFMTIDGCEQWKIIQKNSDITLYLYTNDLESFSKSKERAQHVWNKRYPDVKINIERMDFIEINEKSGKFKNIEVIK